jgi:hypothetical protein
MITDESKWGLALVAGNVCLVELTADGSPAWRTIKRWSGDWDELDEPIYDGVDQFVTTYNVHGPDGLCDTGSITMIDATPRTWDEACAIATKCMPGPPGLGVEGHHSAGGAEEAGCCTFSALRSESVCSRALAARDTGGRPVFCLECALGFGLWSARRRQLPDLLNSL